MDKLIDGKGDSDEKKIVSDAVINLYAAYVHWLLYAYNHPLISDSLKNAFHGFKKALRRKPNIRLDITEGRLTVDGEALDGDLTVLGHFASWLSSINIGHDLKIAWNLMRMNSLREKGTYTALATQLAYAMPPVGMDKQRGGWYDVVERELKPGQAIHRYAFHDRKASWQQEQGILAYLGSWPGRSMSRST